MMGLAMDAWGSSDTASLDLIGSRPPRGDGSDVTDESFWRLIRKEFTVSPNLINLNNGGVSPQPLPVQQAHIRYYQYANEAPSYYMWRILDQGRESLRKNLAALCGCSAEEIAINRNATEGLNSVIFGLPLGKGDEVILGRYDYPNMMNAWKQRARRDGIVLRWVDLELPSEDEEYLVQAYLSQIGPRTRVLHLTHMINWTGQLLPVKRITAEAQKRGVQVIVDAAHSFAQVDFTISDIGCDYLATSLHKWLCAPFGSGLLYIRKDRIPEVWALLSNDNPEGPDIRKFESLGTRSFASEMAIGAALDFHHLVGPARKENRLRYLKDYWLREAVKIDRVSSYTPTGAPWSCALAVVGVEGRNARQIDKFLMKEYSIHTVGIEYEKVNGIRVTPHVYTSLEDLDRLLEGLRAFART